MTATKHASEYRASYVGVSGVAHASEQEMIHHFAEKHVADTDRFVMSGIQAGTKTQLDGIETRYGRDWHPVGEEISRAGFADATGLVRPYVHAFFPDATLEPGLEKIMERTTEFTAGIQLNRLPWLDQDYGPLLERFRSDHPDVAIVLQAHEDVLVRCSPEELAKRLTELPINDVLFDASHGRGKELDVEQIQPFIHEIYEQDLPIGVVVAGGLEAKNIGRLFGFLARKYPGLSCDAEGRLRAGPEGRTWLSLPAAERYLSAWSEAVEREWH